MTQSIAYYIWGIGILAWVLIRLPRRKKAKRTAVVTDRKSTIEYISLTLCILGLGVFPAIQLFTGLFDYANWHFSPLLAFVGLLALIGFLVMFHLSHKYLAKNWSVTLEIRQDHELVQNGIYQHIRHPMYTSFWLWGICQALLIQNWIAGLAGLASVALLYFSRIENEEQMMLDQFGDAYVDYCGKTNRLLPKIF